jgi:hypothetical protein
MYFPRSLYVEERLTCKLMMKYRIMEQELETANKEAEGAESDEERSKHIRNVDII